MGHIFINRTSTFLVHSHKKTSQGFYALSSEAAYDVTISSRSGFSPLEYNYKNGNITVRALPKWERNIENKIYDLLAQIF